MDYQTGCQIGLLLKRAAPNPIKLISGLSDDAMRLLPRAKPPAMTAGAGKAIGTHSGRLAYAPRPGLPQASKLPVSPNPAPQVNFKGPMMGPSGKPLAAGGGGGGGGVPPSSGGASAAPGAAPPVNPRIAPPSTAATAGAQQGSSLRRRLALLGGAGAAGGLGLGAANEVMSYADPSGQWDPQGTGWAPDLHHLRINPYEVGAGPAAANFFGRPLQSMKWLMSGPPPEIDNDFIQDHSKFHRVKDPTFTGYDEETGKATYTGGEGQATVNPILADHLRRTQQKNRDAQSIVDMMNSWKPPETPATSAPAPGAQSPGGTYSVGGQGPIPSSRVQRRYLLDSVGGM